MNNVFKPLAKSVFTPLGLKAAASAADAGIDKKLLDLGGSYDPRAISSQYPLDFAQQTTTLIKSNEEMQDFMKIVKSLEDS